MANTICWFDLGVANLERAQKFYSKVLQKDLAIVNEHGCEFVLFPHEENSSDVAGCLMAIKDFKPSNSDLLIYFDVNGRLHDAVNQAKHHGGSVINEIEAIGPWGYRSIILDSEGNKIALYSQDNK